MSTLHALLVLATEAAGGHETSKTPFYVAGGAAAAWAVLLALFGLSRPSFPSPGAARAVMAVSAVLVAAAMTTAVTTA